MGSPSNSQAMSSWAGTWPNSGHSVLDATGEPQNPRLPGAHGSASGACSQVLSSEIRYGIELMPTGFKQREIPVDFLEAPEVL